MEIKSRDNSFDKTYTAAASVRPTRPTPAFSLSVCSRVCMIWSVCLVHRGMSSRPLTWWSLRPKIKLKKSRLVDFLLFIGNTGHWSLLSGGPKSYRCWDIFFQGKLNHECSDQLYLLNKTRTKFFFERRHPDRRICLLRKRQFGRSVSNRPSTKPVDLEVCRSTDHIVRPYFDANGKGYVHISLVLFWARSVHLQKKIKKN